MANEREGGHPTVVYQAQGMVAVQAECSLDRALYFLQEMADATDLSLEEVAEEVTNRRVTFHPTPRGVTGRRRSGHRSA